MGNARGVEGEITGRRSGMTEEDGAATKQGGRARGGWAARIEQFGGVVRPVLYLRLKFGLRQYLRGVTWTSS